MPHVAIEYSVNLAPVLDAEAVHRAASRTGVVEIGGLRKQG